MNESEARVLARDINEYPGWTAYAGELPQPPNRWYVHTWCVHAQHTSMQGKGMVQLVSWEDFEIARLAWE